MAIDKNMLEVFGGIFESQQAAEELFKDFPYGQKIIKVLKEKFADKLKRRVNTAIVLYDFDWGGHFSNHFLSQMREKKTDEYHIFRIENVYPYK